MGRGTFVEVLDRLGALREVRNGLGDPRGGLGRVRGTLWRSGMGGEHSERFETGRRTLPEVRDGSGDIPGGPGRV